MGHKRIQMTKSWLSLVLVAVVVVLLGMILIYVTQPKTLDDIGLQRIISISNDLKRKDSDRYCEDYLQVLPESAKHMVWPRLGLFPPGNQLREETLIKGCVRTTIAIFPDASSANTAFQSLRSANNDNEATNVVYDIAYDDMVMFTTPFVFEYAISMLDGPAEKYEGENRLLITEKCHTVVTIFVFKRNEKTNQSTTFGVAIEDSEIISYAKQIHERIEDTICPIVNPLDEPR